jgi:hypothetical protein
MELESLLEEYQADGCIFPAPWRHQTAELLVWMNLGNVYSEFSPAILGM